MLTHALMGKHCVSPGWSAATERGRGAQALKLKWRLCTPLELSLNCLLRFSLQQHLSWMHEKQINISVFREELTQMIVKLALPSDGVLPPSQKNKNEMS